LSEFGKEFRERVTKAPPLHGDVRDQPHSDNTLRGRSVTFRQVWSVRCRHCGSGPGWGCRTSTNFSARTHSKRINDAEEAAGVA
jgi:hypothetical protein